MGYVKQRRRHKSDELEIKEPKRMERELVALCASHIASVRRASYLRSMVRSWVRQTWRPRMYLSVSWDECVAPIVERVLNEMEAEEDLTILRQGPKAMSQFQHYREMSRRLSGEDTWVFFSDDDDLWHEHRAAVLMSRVLSAPDEILSIKMSGTVIGEVGGETSADVWGALEAGRMRALLCRAGEPGVTSASVLRHVYGEIFEVQRGVQDGFDVAPPGSGVDVRIPGCWRARRPGVKAVDNGDDIRGFAERDGSNICIVAATIPRRRSAQEESACLVRAVRAGDEAGD